MSKDRPASRRSARGCYQWAAGNKAVVPNGRPTVPPSAKPGAPRAGKVTVTPNRAGAAGRGAARRSAKHRSGFHPSSLDIAMMLAGVVGVAILVFAVLSANKAPTTTAGGPARRPRGRATPRRSPWAPSRPISACPPPMDVLAQPVQSKVVLLEFLATWCPHCQENSKIFNQVSDAYKDKNVQFWRERKSLTGTIRPPRRRLMISSGSAIHTARISPDVRQRLLGVR